MLSLPVASFREGWGDREILCAIRSNYTGAYRGHGAGVHKTAVLIVRIRSRPTRMSPRIAKYPHLPTNIRERRHKIFGLRLAQRWRRLWTLRSIVLTYRRRRSSDFVVPCWAWCRGLKWRTADCGDDLMDGGRSVTKTVGTARERGARRFGTNSIIAGLEHGGLDRGSDCQGGRCDGRR
jgi:hypothetical protein